jgi:hypothetical protein
VEEAKVFAQVIYQPAAPRLPRKTMPPQSRPPVSKNLAAHSSLPLHHYLDPRDKLLFEASPRNCLRATRADGCSLIMATDGANFSTTNNVYPSRARLGWKGGTDGRSDAGINFGNFHDVISK